MPTAGAGSRPDQECVTVDDAISCRRSVRHYLPNAVPEGVVRSLVDLARHAPSSMDGQPCHFIVIRDRATCRQLADIKRRHCPPDKRSYPCDFLADAPVVIVVCVEREQSHDRALENGVMASAFLLLAAAGRGLGTVYLTAQRQGDVALADEIRGLLAIPAGIDPITLIPLGYPAGSPHSKELRDIDTILHHERFDAI